MLRAPSLLLLALTVAVPAVAVPRDASAETKKQKKEREAKEKAEAEAAAEAAAAAEAQASADAAAAEKAAAEAAAAPPAEEVAPAPAVVEDAPMVAGNWSMSIIDRPLNLLKGMIRVSGDLGIAKISITTGTTTTSATGIGLGIGAGYGISDKLEAGVGYGISLKEFEAKGPLTLYGLFNITHSEKLRISAGAQVGYNLASEQLGIGAGLAFQYHLGPKMMVYMPPTHLQISLDPTTAAISLPVGFGFQATPNVFAYAQTNLFDIGLKPSGSAFIFADRTPLTVGGSYSPSNKR